MEERIRLMLDAKAFTDLQQPQDGDGIWSGAAVKQLQQQGLLVPQQPDSATDKGTDGFTNANVLTSIKHCLVRIAQEQ